MPNNNETNIIDLIKLKNLLLDALMLKDEYDIKYIESILTDETLELILKKNFSNDINLAIEKLTDNYENVYYEEHRNNIEKEINKIPGLNNVALKMYKKLMSKGTNKILIIADSDADGSSGIAAWLLLKENLPDFYKNKLILCQSKKVEGTKVGHGINSEHIQKMIKEGEFKAEEITAVMTIDNGINNNEEVKKILKILKKADIYITDHHTPNETVVEENERVIIACSKYDPSTKDKLPKQGSYFASEENISGGQVGAEVVKLISNRIVKQAYKITSSFGMLNKENINNFIKGLNEISMFSVTADYVNADYTMMPTNNILIKKYSSIATLINTNNNIGFLVGDNSLKEKLSKFFNLSPEKTNSVYISLSTLNYKAKRLLELYEAKNSKNVRDLSDIILDIRNIEKKDYQLKENYIAQLRPAIIKDVSLESVEYLSSYYDILKKENIKIYETFREIQKILIDDIRKSIDNGVDNISQMKVEDNDASFIVLKDGINRKMATIAENTLSTGFIARIDSKNVGSFRSRFPHQKIFDENVRKIILDKLNIEIVIAGHPLAAGINLKTKTGKQVTKKDLEFISNIVNKKIQQISEKEDKKDILSINHFELMSNINSLILADLPGRFSFSFNVSFNKNQINKMLMKEGPKKYGWKVFKMTLDGNSFIMPVNVLNKIMEGNNTEKYAIEFKPFSGSFIANKLLNVTSQDNIITKKTFISQNEELVKYYENMDWTDDKKVIKKEELTNEEMGLVHFIKYAENGKHIQEEAQSKQIELINNTDIKNIVVLDVETLDGLGNAMINNIGMMVSSIDENSGIKIKQNDFMMSKFTTVDNKEVLILDTSKLKKITSEEKDKLSKKDKLYIVKDSDGNMYNNFTKETFPIIYNYTHTEDGQIIYNQKMVGNNIAAFVKEDDMEGKEDYAISMLTHIDEDWINKYGKTAEEVDEALSSYLKKIVGDNKFLFQAHNIMFDFPLMAQFPKVYDIILKQAIFYDSANAVATARNRNSSYSSVNIADIVTNKNTKIVFNDQKGAENSLNKLLQDISENNDGFITDVSMKYQLKYENDNLSLISLDNLKKTVLIEEASDISEEDIKNILQVKENFLKAEKYGVQTIDTIQLITNILLEEKNIDREDIDTSGFEEEKIAYYDNFIRMLEKYKFTNEPKDNINNYVNSIGDKEINGEDKIKSLISENVKEKISSGEIKPIQKINEYVEEVYEKYLQYLETSIKDIFLTNNNSIHQHYTLVKIMTNILPKLPNLDYITVNQINILANNEGISFETMDYIIKIIKKYEKKWGVKINEIEELHFNLVSKIVNQAGDTTLENLLLLVYIIRIMSNPLNKKSANVNIRAIIESNIIRTHKKKYNFINSYYDINSYSAKQSLNFDRSVVSQRVSETKKMKESEENNIKIKSDFINKDAIITLNLKKAEKTNEDPEEIISEIQYLAFLKNVENTASTLVYQLYKMFDTKVIHILNEIYINNNVESSNGKYKLNTESILLSLRKKEVKEKLSEIEGTLIREILENPQEWQNKFEKIDWAAIKEDILLLGESKKGFTTVKQIDIITENLLHKFEEKVSQLKIANKYIKKTESLKEEMVAKLGKKYNIKIDGYKNKTKSDIINKVFDLISDWHYAMIMEEHFNINDYAIFYSSSLGYMSIEEKEIFVDSLYKEISDVLISLHSNIEVENIKNMLNNIVNAAFHSVKPEKQEDEVWINNISKTFQNIRKSLLTSEYDEMTEFLIDKYLNHNEVMEEKNNFIINT